MIAIMLDVLLPVVLLLLLHSDKIKIHRRFCFIFLVASLFGLLVNGTRGAWLAVQDANGAEALTRRGDLRLDADGRLLTGDGSPVLGEDGPIQVAAGFANVRIGRDGSVETRLAGDQPWVQMGRLKLVSPDPASLSRGADGLFRSATAEADPAATVTTGAIERSNVESTAALVELIEQSRSFEMQTKLLSAAREMDEGTAQLMRVQ